MPDANVSVADVTATSVAVENSDPVEPAMTSSSVWLAMLARMFVPSTSSSGGYTARSSTRTSNCPETRLGSRFTSDTAAAVAGAAPSFASFDAGGAVVTLGTWSVRGPRPRTDPRDSWRRSARTRS